MFRHLFLIAGMVAGGAASAEDDRPRYTRTATGYLMVLRQGDDVLARLTQLAQAERLPSASFTGMGFVSEARFGYFDFDKRTYDPQVKRSGELASLTGTIGWQKGEPSIHAHGIVTDGSFVASGGHILGLTVGTGSVEVTIVRHEQRLEREMDQSIGANVLQVR